VVAAFKSPASKEFESVEQVQFCSVAHNECLYLVHCLHVVLVGLPACIGNLRACRRPGQHDMMTGAEAYCCHSGR
jgi:hypothetical protein